VAAEAVGLAFEAIVFITMRQEDRETLLGFEEGVAAIPQVVQAERLFGDPDYLLRIVTSDLAAYQRLQDDKLSALPGVQRMTSTLVMKRVVHDRPLPALRYEPLSSSVGTSSVSTSVSGRAAERRPLALCQ